MTALAELVRTLGYIFIGLLCLGIVPLYSLHFRYAWRAVGVYFFAAGLWLFLAAIGEAEWSMWLRMWVGTAAAAAILVALIANILMAGRRLT